MGKRSKAKNTLNETAANKKKKISMVENDNEEPNNTVCEKDDSKESLNVVNKVVNKRKITPSSNKPKDIASQETTSTNDDKTNTTHINKQNKNSKKIIFVDDAPVEVSSESEQPVKSHKKTKKNNKKPSADEEEVNDEDIDKFCDDLTAEDNVQFDNWVKLIEAKLHAKK